MISLWSFNLIKSDPPPPKWMKPTVFASYGQRLMPVVEGGDNLLQNGARLRMVIRRHQIIMYHVTLSSQSWWVCGEYCCFHQGRDTDCLAPKAGLRCFQFYYSCDVTLVVRHNVGVSQQLWHRHVPSWRTVALSCAKNVPTLMNI